ncbi:MAG: beta-propeller domain-containing protein [Pseudomonadota bacterium]
MSCSDSGTTPTIDDGPLPEASTLVPPGSDDEFRDYIVKGLEQWGGVADNSTQVQAAFARAPLPVPVVDDVASGDAIASPAAPEADFGIGLETNVLVRGVDEMDQVKFDGDYFYLANWEYLQIVPVDGATEDTVRIPYDEESFGQRGLYRYEEGGAHKLGALSQPYPVFWTDAWFAPWGWNETTSVEIYDVRSPESPALEIRMEFDGSYVDSRRIGDRLYVITRYTPFVDELIAFAETDADRDHNETVLSDLEVDDVLPEMRRSSPGGNTDAPLVRPQDCFVPDIEIESDHFYNPSMTTITSVDLNTHEVRSLCMSAGVTGIHMSLYNVYIATTQHTLGVDDTFRDVTQIHRFALDANPARYVGSGAVRGAFWGDPKFLMGEHDSNLTVVTTEFLPDEENRLRHRLAVLGSPSVASDFELPVRGQLPNANRPESIGKPNEAIFASRIFGDRAYIVTFLRIDPLYVIDLADPDDPAILGELEIPGFSTYLHPLSANLLLGFGQNTEDNTNLGLNLRLFDVTDPANPGVLSDLEIGGRWTYSDLQWDDHAFTILSDSAAGLHRFAIPFSIVSSEGSTSTTTDELSLSLWQENALYLYEVDESARSMVHTGRVIAENHATGDRHQPGCCAWNDRSFIVDDDEGLTVHYVNENRIFSALWESPAVASNIFVPTVFDSVVVDPVCTDDVRPLLSVSSRDASTGHPLECGVVTLVEGDFTAAVDLCTETFVDVVGERSGRYEVAIEVVDYERWVGSDVVVQFDGCHVATPWLEAWLTPEP